jgi:hypothetical protein
MGKILVRSMFAFLSFASPARAEDFLYTDAQADCAARIIFMNECSRKEENLLFWSPKEDFPSLGLGHFIWYPEGATGPYRESFPPFLHFARGLGLDVPAWVTGAAPWKTRDEFLRDLGSERMNELLAFLSGSKREQAHFILWRFQRIFPSILDDVDPADQPQVQEKYELLRASPEGMFAMVDYVNFKGEGYQSDARYEGVGWGLAQVLLEMEVPDDPDDALEEFIAAAERVLERRVAHAPRPEVEKTWLPGWKNRLHGYRAIDCA